MIGPRHMSVLYTHLSGANENTLHTCTKNSWSLLQSRCPALGFRGAVINLDDTLSRAVTRVRNWFVLHNVHILNEWDAECMDRQDAM